LSLYYQEESYAMRRPKKNAPKISSTLIGAAGVHFVAAELSRRGALVLVTVRNTKGIDALATGEDGRKHVTIQVKSSYIRPTFWPLGSVLDPIPPEHAFYIFVRNAPDAPRGTPELPPMEAFVVPASVVYQTADHLLPPGSAAWTAGAWPGKSTVNLEEYRNRWDLILAALR
jgi:hypothetical protein